MEAFPKPASGSSLCFMVSESTSSFLSAHGDLLTDCEAPMFDDVLSSRSMEYNLIMNVTEAYVKRKFQCERVVGSGHTAIVMKAKDKKKERTVAVKKMMRHRASREILKRESAVLDDLDHPNIVVCYEVFETTEHFYMILEYVGGGDLFSKLSSKHVDDGQPDELVVMGWTHQVLGALAYMHKAGYAHRDIKLENVLIGEDGVTAKLCDFGFCCKVKDYTDAERVGTPEYMAPEQVQGGPEVDMTKGDVWSAGVLLYSLVAHCYDLGFPWPMADEKHEMYRAYVSGQRPDMPWACFSPQTRTLLHMMLQVDPTQRCTAEEALKFIAENWGEQLGQSEFAAVLSDGIWMA